ncbi:MAG: hypothetical protein ACFFCL_15280, partial [Promethearchaeota archaeon]
IFKGFFPVLFAMNLGIILMNNQIIQELVLKPAYITGSLNAQFLTFAGLLPIVIGIGLGLFSPVWFLLDAGIVYSNRLKVKGTSKPTEVRSVGGWYLSLLKGYAGISMIISFYTFLSMIIQSLITSSDELFRWILIAGLWPVLPFLLAIMVLIGVILLDKTFNHRKRFILKWAKKLGINSPLEYNLDES